MDDKNIRSITLVGQAMPLLLDGSMMVGYVYGVPWLIERFQTPSWFNGAILISAYVLLLIAVYTIRELDNGSHNKSVLASVQKRGCLLSFLLLLAFNYIIFCTAIFLMIAPVGTGNGTLMLVFTIGVIGVLVAFNVRARGRVHADSLVGLLFQMLAVLGVNVITLITLAVWQSPGFDLNPGPEIPIVSRIILFVLGYFLALVFYAPPRLLLTLVTGNRMGLLSFLASLGYFVWDQFVRVVP